MFKKAFKTIPEYICPKDSEISSLRDFINKYDKLIVLTGAGVSTESGIQDYRSEKTGLYYRRNRPIFSLQDFMSSSLQKKKYWLRNFLSFHKYALSQPNSTHTTLAKLEEKGLLSYVITQNIDRLHQRAGSSKVLELHGTLYDVRCMQCGEVTARKLVQDMIQRLNADWLDAFKPALNDVGEVLLGDKDIDHFKLPLCSSCHGILKPDIIFYGEDIPHWLISAAACLIDQSDALLILGSSLQVHSGYQYALQAKQSGKKIAIVNIGPTKADDLCDLKINSNLGDVISRLEV